MEDTKVDAKQEMLENLSKLEQESEMEGIVKDNKLTFKIENTTYRLRKATYLEKQEIDAYRRKKYLSYLKDESMLYKKDLVALHKAKGVDILKMEQTSKELQNSIDNLMLLLAPSTIEKEIADLKSKIIALKTEQATLNYEKSEYLAYCLEEQLTNSTLIFYAVTVCEKQEGEKFVKAFKNYDEFINSDNAALVNKMIYYVSYIVYSE